MTAPIHAPARRGRPPHDWTPAEERVIRLCHAHGWTMQAIAKTLNVSVPTLSAKWREMDLPRRGTPKIDWTQLDGALLDGLARGLRGVRLARHLGVSHYATDARRKVLESRA